jgi:hypothetical protein
MHVLSPTPTYRRSCESGLQVHQTVESQEENESMFRVVSDDRIGCVQYRFCLTW